MRIFVTTPAVKGGSTVLSWLLGQHSAFNGSPIKEEIELGAMLNVLDHIPGRRLSGAPYAELIGAPEMSERIRGFTDDIIKHDGQNTVGVKFTNFGSYRWLRHVFPDDRIIVIVRDIFDWYASIKIWNTTRHGGWNIDAVDRWMLSASSSLSYLKDIKIVHLENLISNPQSTMMSVHSYLGLERERVVLDGQEEIFKAFSSRPDSYVRPSSGLVKTPIGRKSELLDSEIERIRLIRENEKVASVLYGNSRRIKPTRMLT